MRVATLKVGWVCGTQQLVIQNANPMTRASISNLALVLSLLYKGNNMIHSHSKYTDLTSGKVTIAGSFVFMFGKRTFVFSYKF